jgi:hypothetical protein
MHWLNSGIDHPIWRVHATTQRPHFEFVKFEGHMALFCHNVAPFIHFKIVILVCQATVEKGTGKSRLKK